MMPTFDEVMILTETISNPTILERAECRAMYDALCQLPTGAAVVEIGCDLGRSSSLIFQISKARNLLTIHVDPWQWDLTKARQWMEMMCERNPYHPFIVLHMKTVEAGRYIQQLTPEGIDLVFIDGSHDQPDVDADLEIAATRVKPGGFLTAHDYPSGGVTESIDAFIARGGWTKENQAGGFGVWRRN